MPDDSPEKPAGELGFDLRKVSWGYRRIFADAIGQLLAEGTIGEGHEAVTRTFLDMLDHSRPGSFDFALKEFLGAINPRTKWLLELPGVFEDLCALGRELAEQKLAYGIAFFRLWGQGGFGTRAGDVLSLIRHVRGLRGVDAELAQAFMVGYGTLLDQLNAQQISRFVEELVVLHGRSPRTAIDFAALHLKSATAFVRSLTQQARLTDMRDRLARLATVVCAEAVRARSFPAVQGQSGHSDVREWLGNDPARCALVTVIEITRILQNLRAHMPGVRRLLDFGLSREFDPHPPRTNTDAVLLDCLRESGDRPALIEAIRAAAGRSNSCFDAAREAEALLDEFRGAADAAPRALIFFPDFYYPAGLQPAPASAMVVDLSRQRRQGKPEPADAQDTSAPADGDRQDEKEQADGVAVAFVYPEWNQNENDYYEDWCFLREHRPVPDRHFHRLDGVEDERAFARARRLFERLKPDIVRKEKYLTYGDEIDIDRLVEFCALRRRLPSPRVNFYQKPFIKKRDLAVALLLDVSGSTAALPTDTGAAPGSRSAPGRPAGSGGDGERIIDLEKRAALTLGAGLDALGDRFGIYGFSGNGREHCDFFIYKDMEEPFAADARRRLLAASPTASTRIGVALRHCREKLVAVAARKKIVILITDGKPQDSGYDPASRYAQYDVRMACQECARHDIHVVCISTLENSRADLEIMFPQRRYVVLEDMSRLVDVLPALYLKMTT